MKIKRFYKVFLGVIATGMLALLVMSGCSNGKNGATGKTGTQGQTGPLSSSPVITGLDPTTASFNTIITITGENFTSTPSGMTVYCDNVPAMVVGATPTQVTFTGCGKSNVVTPYQAKVTMITNNLTSNGFNEWIVPSGYISQFPAASLTGPQGEVYDSATGKLYVADNAGVFAVDNATGWTTKIVPAGCPNCVLSAPAGITMDNSGNLIVTDSGNNTLVGVNPTTGTTWYVLGPGNGLLSTPIGVTYSNGDLYVANNGSSAITQIDTTNLSAVNLTLSLALSSAPEGIAADGSGNLYVACSGGTASKIVVSGTNGTVTNSYVTGVPSAYGISISGTSLAMTSNANPNIYTVPLAGGAAAQIGCTTFPWETGTHPASSVIPDGSNGVFVGDPNDGLVYHVTSACNVSTYAEGFGDPYDIAYLNGNFYVFNDLFGRNTYGDALLDVRSDGAVKVLAQVPGGGASVTVNPSGGLTVGSWNGGVYTVSLAGAVSNIIPSGATNGAAGLAYDTSGTLYIDNENNTNIDIRKWNGSSLTSFATGTGKYGYQITIHNGLIYITANDGNVYTTNASTGGSVSLYLPASIGFSCPEGIEPDTFGNLVMVDYCNYGLFRIDPQGHVTALVPHSTTPMIHPNGVAIPPSQMIYTVEEGTTTSRMWVIAP